MTRHAKLPKLGLGPIEGGEAHDVGERRPDGDGRSRCPREQRGPSARRPSSTSPNPERRGWGRGCRGRTLSSPYLAPESKTTRKEGRIGRRNAKLSRPSSRPNFPDESKSAGEEWPLATLLRPPAAFAEGAAPVTTVPDTSIGKPRCSTKNLSDERKLSPTVAPPREPTPAFFARWCSPEIRVAAEPRGMGHMLSGSNPMASANAEINTNVLMASYRRSPFAPDLERMA
eukprot:scaffold4766_cov115-Isochrysis_galbana.AAC.4